MKLNWLGVLDHSSEIEGSGDRVMKRAPFGEGMEIEIRPIMELADFPPEALPAGLAEREQAMRDDLAKKASQG